MEAYTFDYNELGDCISQTKTSVTPNEVTEYECYVEGNLKQVTLPRSRKRAVIFLLLLFQLFSCKKPPVNLIENYPSTINISADKQAITQRNGNCLNGSNLWVDQDWIYFIDANRGESLYKMKADGSQYFTLDKSPRLSYVFLMNNKVYYFEYSDWMTISLDGSDPQEMKVLDNGQPIFLLPSTVIPSNDWIYFKGFSRGSLNIEDSSLYKMKPDGSMVTLLYSGDIDSLNVTDDAIYFTNSVNQGIYRCNLDGTEKKVLSSNYAKSILVHGSYLYFLDENNMMFCLDEKTLKLRKIGFNSIGNYNIAGDWIYFSNKNEHDSLFRMSLEGKQVQQINEEVTGGILVFGENVYYLNISQGYKYYVLNQDKTVHRWIGSNSSIKPISEENNPASVDSLPNQYQTYNRISSGRMDVLDGWLYVCLPVDEAYDLVRMRFDGSKTYMIKNYTYLSSLSIWRDSIFYRHASDRDSAYNGTLNKLSIDGKNRQDVIDYPIDDYLIQGDWLFFSSDNRDRMLLKRNLKTGEQFVVSPDVASDINLTSEWIYFASFREQNHLYKVRTNGKDRTRLLAESVNTLMLHGDWIYYLNKNDELYRINTDGSGKMEMSHTKMNTYNLTEKWIYYIDQDSSQLFRMDHAGKNLMKVNSRYTFDICIFGEQVFYIGYGENEYCVFRLNTDGSEQQIYPLVKKDE